jgi:hypothetical protein
MPATAVIILPIMKSRYILCWYATHLCYSPIVFQRFTVFSVAYVTILAQSCHVTIQTLRDLRFIHGNFADVCYLAALNLSQSERDMTSE